MKNYEVIKCKRQALGMTQAEFAERIGVSSATISNFEKGEEVSISVRNNIKYGIEALYRNLNRIEYHQALLISQALCLEYQTDEEKLKSLYYMNMVMGNLGINITNALSKEEAL